MSGSGHIHSSPDLTRLLLSSLEYEQRAIAALRLREPQRRAEKPAVTGFWMVAGAGFEPATFGL